MTRWKSEKHFCSWLRLCPDNRISGGKRSRGKPHRGHNRAAQILRVCAQAAIQSKSALGAFGRRLRARMDAPRAIKALAHSRAERDRLAASQPAGASGGWRQTGAPRLPDAQPRQRLQGYGANTTTRSATAST